MSSLRDFGPNMPSSSETQKSSSSSSSSRKDEKTKSKSGSSSSTLESADEVRAAEHQARINSALTSHAGYLAKAIPSLAASLSITVEQLAGVLGMIYITLHLVLPPFLLPHLSALITLIIPLQSTLRSIKVEMDKKSTNAARDSCQWLAYWVIYAMFEFARGWVSIWRLGWKAGFEIVRSVGLVAVAGPWFGREGLRPKGPSEELKKAEKADAEIGQKEKIETDKRKAREDKLAKAEKERERKEKD